MPKIEIIECNDSNDSESNKILVPSHNHNKIILLLMIKNESKIIKRCIEAAINHVDAICILDTGSTDNTVDVCNSVLTELGKPFKISVEPFKNFGFNRSVSFLKAQELCNELKWDADKTYALAVDADMNIVVFPEFKDFELKQNGYTVIQQNGHLKYYNTRLMKCSYPWKCVGSTHEYWSGDPTEKVPYEALFIDDKNDGGCKSDKFERDVRLLTEEVKENPKNDRAYYYLGQSLKDLQRFEEAICMFMKRIELGGWVEEVFYSYYQIGKCYHHMNKPHEMELWMNKAFENRQCRAEPLYHLTKYYREVSQHYKAYHYYLKGKNIPYPKDDVLFIEEHVYKGLFDYENTILACYVNGRSKQDSLYDVVTYINKNIPHYVHNVWDNLHYYVEPLDSNVYHGSYSRLFFPDHEEYKVSSCCLVEWSNDKNKRFLLNTRYVNYSIDVHGSYHMRSPDGHVKTKNGYTYLNASYFPTENVCMMHEQFDNYPSNIEGLEDVRVFKHNNSYFCTASSKNVSNTGNIEMTLSVYEPNTISNVKIIQPPRPSGCEKNWIYVPNKYLHVGNEKDNEKSNEKFNFIYGWNPLEIGAVEDNKLTIHTTQLTPSIFNRFRGSSPLVEYLGKLYCVVHFVKYSTPRVYYHSVVQFSLSMKVEAFAVPFCFRQTKIEYCLGFHINDDKAYFIFSENDTNPGLISVPFKNLRMVPI
jgi:tetratricopeptide (TPR) repeat protein